MITLILGLQIYLVGTGTMLIVGLLSYLRHPNDESDGKAARTIIRNAFHWPWLLACRIIQYCDSPRHSSWPPPTSKGTNHDHHSNPRA